MGKRVNYRPAAKINPLELKNTAIKDAREETYFQVLKDTIFSNTIVEEKETTGLAKYYNVIKTVSDGGRIFMLMSNENGDRTKNGIVVLDAYSLEIITSSFGMFTTDYVSHIIVDENNLYVAGYNSGTNAKVMKLLKSTLQVSATYTNTNSQTGTTALKFVSSNIFLAWKNTVGATRGIVSILKSDMSAVVASSGGSGGNYYTDFAGASPNLYVSIDTSPGTILNLNFSTLGFIAQWTGAAGENKVIAIEYDVNYIYAALSAVTVKLIKINPSNMTTALINTFADAANGDRIEIAQTKYHVRVFWSPDGTYCAWKRISKFDLSEFSGADNINMLQARTVIDAGIWQILVGKTTGGLYKVRKEMLDGAGFLSIGTISKARAYRATTIQTIPAAIDTKVQLNAKSFDTDSEWDTSANYRWTARIGGYYQVNASIQYITTEIGKIYNVAVKKNGVAVLNGQHQGAIADTTIVNASDVIYVPTGSYLEVWAYHNSTVNKDINFGETLTFMSVHRMPDYV